MTETQTTAKKSTARPATSFRGARRLAARETGVLRFWSVRAQNDRPYRLTHELLKIQTNDRKRGAAGRWYSGKKKAA